MSFSVTYPVLETERLVLRGPQASDYPAFGGFYDTDRSRFVGGPMQPRNAWRHFATEIGHWAMRGFGMWTVTLKDTGAPVGLVGCWYPIDWPERELGWILYPEAEGKGIGHEAATAARAHAFGPLGWETAVSYIEPENVRSIALADRLGARRDDTAERLAIAPDCLVYRHTKGAI